MNAAPLLFAAAACLALYYYAGQQEGDGGIVDTIDSAISSLADMTASVTDSDLLNSNVAAFLALIRYGESSNGNEAYTMLYGGGQFSDMSRHPQQYFDVGDGRRTSAAGAYQITYTTWKALVSRYGIPDFTPASQDFAAVCLIKGRGALGDVEAGRFDRAIAKCRPEWTSLPGAMESRYSMDKAKQIILAYGGQYAGENIA